MEFSSKEYIYIYMHILLGIKSSLPSPPEGAAYKYIRRTLENPLAKDQWKKVMTKKEIAKVNKAGEKGGDI